MALNNTIHLTIEYDQHPTGTKLFSDFKRNFVDWVEYRMQGEWEWEWNWKKEKNGTQMIIIESDEYIAYDVKYQFPVA